MIKSSSISYRPDIDGMRAFAILGVLIYHFFPNVLPGGFLGVDVFFVISGYLISKILIQSLHNDTFSIRTFYAKRIRRIFPALILIGAVFFIYGFFVLFPIEFESLTRHIANGAIFNANHALYRDMGYFDAAITHKPFMHLWSLSVEEQFYVLWPFILWFFHKTNKLKWLLPFTILAICISYGFNIFYMKRNPGMAFFWLHARFWEIAVGALMAHIEMNRNKTRSIFLEHYGSILGVLLIVGCFWLLPHDTDHFVYWSLLPIIGAALIVRGKTESFGGKILSFRPFVWIGLISYPLYLLHWPLISFLYILEPSLLTFSVKMILLGASIVSSYGIYRFIETPIRKSKNPKVPRRLFVSMLVLGLISFAGARELYRPWIVYKLPETMQTKKAREDWGFKMEWFDYQNVSFQKLGEGTPAILFFGDSYMQEYMSRMCLLSREKNIPIVSVTYGGRCPVVGVARKLKKGGFDDSRDFTKTVMEYAEKSDVKKIVLSAAWIGYLSAKDVYAYVEGDQVDFSGSDIGFKKTTESLKQMIMTFRKRGKNVYLVLTKPSGHNPEAYFERGCWGISKNRKNMDVLRKDWDQASKKIHDRLREVAQEAGATIIDPTPHFCNDEICRTVTDDGDFIYMDGGHIRSSYAEKNVRFLDFLFD